ncbi:(Fe-S)-binding protein [Bacillus tuaregi]|uniref:(Fe-S)-binding protein n=1 Tax=Bacillus tuaregi TaxID=1816695 RepID=UPI0008F808F5|nr:(Fe-S)-binding protein [Bacillus tuaregi]
MITLLSLLIFLTVAGYAFYLFIKLVYSRYLFIKLGKRVDFNLDLRERLNSLLINGFGQRKLFKDKKSGIMHFILFYGFFIIQIGLIELIIKGVITGYEFPLGEAHKYFSFLQEWTTFLMLCAILYAAYRRYGEKLKRLQWRRDAKAAFVYSALTVLTTSILLSLGFEAVMLGHVPSFTHAPFSAMVAMLFSGIGTTASTVLFYVFWWIHMLAVMSFMVFVPQSKQAHELFALINIFFKKVGSGKRLKKIDFKDETVEEFGVGRIENFRRDQLIDLYACVECGRCTNMCPASGTGKQLSPMHLMIKLRDHLTEKGAAVTSREPWLPTFAFAGAGAHEAAAGSVALEENLVGDIMTEQELWACTTCRNCEDQCPVMNEHVEKIIDMRRYLILTQGEMPADALRYFQNIERQNNPWGLNRKDRVKWRDGMEDIVKTVKETDEFEVLYWVGSMGSYDAKSQKIAKAFVRILDKAGVKFAILGNEEGNSGDSARRLGNEYLFQELCAQNIETFQRYGVKKILTTDPHAYNLFKNEYPEFGFEGEVLHHTEFILQLLKDGRLNPEKEVKEKVAYHDSCYIGRYNGMYDIPREILKAIPGVEILELERSREEALCCGAGGGLMWMEEHEGTRVNIARTEMALATNPTVIGSNCPYCLTMLTDGTKAKEVEEQVQTLDIVEIIERSL